MTYAALKYDVSAPDSPLPAAAVRRWLHGRWALLFSHPDDFASYGVESDRLLVHVQEAFTSADIRPLALAGPHAVGWVTEVGGCTTTLAFERTGTYTFFDGRRWLGSVKASPGQPFAMAPLKRTILLSSATPALPVLNGA